MLNTTEIAERLGVTSRTVVRWIEQGKLKGYRFGKDYRVEEKAFEEYLQKSKVKGE